jgi:Glycosyl transferase family 2
MKKGPRFIQMDDKEIPPVNADEIRLFSIMRNESLRLPAFLNHYVAMGVTRIIILDNGSEDDTVALALAHPLVHVYRTHESYVTRYLHFCVTLKSPFGGC